MKNSLKYGLMVAAMAATIVACRKEELIVIIPPSEGTTTVFNGGTGGASAVNTAYADLSTASTDSVKRASWDIGFYAGSDFRAIINNTTGAGAKVLTTSDLATVGASDTVGLTLAVNQNAPSAADFTFFDAIDGSITGTVIPAISATAADNKVVIINRGTGGGIGARPWIKAKITRNNNGGYTLQYGTITQTTNFTTVEVSKDPAYNFKFVSFDGGAIVKGEPQKSDWDFALSYSLFQTNFGAGLVPYNFSDLIVINSLGGVQAYQKTYASATVRNEAYAAYNKDSVAVSASLLSNNRWTIGSSWRSTMPATGARTDRFYVLKDGAGNYYKIKFISMGVNDGGERGKPVFEYKLIK